MGFASSLCMVRSLASDQDVSHHLEARLFITLVYRCSTFSILPLPDGDEVAKEEQRSLIEEVIEAD